MPSLSAFSERLQALLLAPSLGHGRMMESYLTAVCALYGFILLVVPNAAISSQATRDVVFDELGRLIALPFLLKAALSGYGILGNIKGWRDANGFRFAGALAGFALFTWYVIKFLLIGAVGALGFPFALVAVAVCVRVMALSSIGLPVPGAPGKK
jgi:hypothetical protein